MNLRILVSGSNGQVGMSLREASESYPDIEFDFFDKSQLDLSDPDSIKKVFQKDYDYFINTAAFTQVDKAESEKELAFRINTKSLEYITDHCPAECRIIHISSDYVYHINKASALLESDLCEPKSIYALSKKKGEEILMDRRPDSLILRSSWIYSIYGNNFVKTMLRLAETNNILRIVSDQQGCPTYAYDLAKAILDIITYLQKTNRDQGETAGIYNYTNSGLTNWAEFAEKIFQYSGLDCKVQKIRTDEYPTAAERPLWSHLSTEKIRSVFKLDIPYWEDSLKDCLTKLKRMN